MPTNQVTHIRRLIDAPPAKLYQALIDPKQIAQWKFPTGMSIKIHHFEGREGGSYRISLTYTTQPGVGKTSAHTDTYHGHFIKLVPNKLVVEEQEFETTDPAMQGVMHSTIRLRAVNGQTELTGTHEDIPPGVNIEDNNEGWQLALDKLAALVEA